MTASSSAALDLLLTLAALLLVLAMAIFLALALYRCARSTPAPNGGPPNTPPDTQAIRPVYYIALPTRPLSTPERPALVPEKSVPGDRSQFDPDVASLLLLLEKHGFETAGLDYPDDLEGKE